MSEPRIAIVAAILIAATVTGCDEPAPPAPQARPVRAVTVEHGAQGEIVSLTGQIRATDHVSLAFRIDGRIIERPVDVGDVVAAGQVIAKLDPQDQENNLRSAQANRESAEAQLTQARLTFARQEKLLKDGWATRAKFDEVEQALKSAKAQVDSARAQLRIAQDQLSYTVLVANAAGTITAVDAESGEVVRAGQPVAQLAHQGGRDAVFDVPERLIRTGPRDPQVHVALTNDPTLRATGRVREVAPQADAATRTFQVKVGLIDPPEAMRLGATVTGSITLNPPDGIEVPASALTKAAGHPAVWVVDPGTRTVSLRRVELLRYDSATVVVGQGIETGETIVTAGVQALRPGQEVRLPGDAK